MSDPAELTAFLRDCVDGDQADLDAAKSRMWSSEIARAEREIEFKRWVIDHGGDTARRKLAVTVYRNRPGYRDEWRP